MPKIAEQDYEIAELKALLQATRDALKAALEKIAELEASASSDIVKPPKPKDKDRRRKKIVGAQKGHKQNLRTP